VPVLSLALVGLLGSPPEPLPSEPRFVLDWQAPANCPARERVELRITELLAARTSAGPRLDARAHVEHARGSYRVELSLHSGDDPPGIRMLADPDCSELAEGVALIIALAVDPDLFAGPIAGPIEDDGSSSMRVLDDQEAAHEGNHADARPPAPEVVLAIPEAPAPEPPTLLHLGAYVLAGAGLNALPGATARLDTGLFATGDHWRIELGLSAWLPRRIADARYQAWAVELAGCGVPRVGIVEFPLCARIEVGAMIGESLGPEGRRAIGPWLAAAPGVGMVVRPKATRGMLGVILRADAVLPLTRPAFATDEGTLLVRVGFGAQILAGLELRLPASRRRPRSVLGRASRGQLGMMPPRRSAE
jgi:hypothetical protein